MATEAIDETEVLEDEAPVEATSEAPSDESSVPAPPSMATRILALHLPTPARRRLLDLECDLVESIDETPDIIVISTRVPVARRSGVAELIDHGVPVVVICHPGGEELAVQLIARGAVTMVAEGSERNILNVLSGTASDHLVETYQGLIDRTFGGSGSGGLSDDITGLPTSSGFELKLAEFGKDGDVPRLGLAEIQIDKLAHKVSAETLAGVRRRIALSLQDAAGHYGAVVYDLGKGQICFLAQDMRTEWAIRLARHVVGVARSFSPGGEPLDVAVGLAGPESAADIETLRMLAYRSLEAAKQAPGRIVDADELAEQSAASLELDTVFALADAVDALDPRGGHSARVSDYAKDIARDLALSDLEVAQIGLAARLHDVGKLGFGEAAFDAQHPDHEACVQTHASRGEEYIRYSAGVEVAAIVRAHHERYDGTGDPDGLTGNEIPFGARVLAVANYYDELTNAGKSAADIAKALRDEADVSLDPELVEAALVLFGTG